MRSIRFGGGATGAFGSKTKYFWSSGLSSEIWAEATAALPGVSVESFDGLLADFVRSRGAVAIVRGLRSAGEFDAEQPMALMNRHLFAGCETVFVVPSADRAHISSRLVREIASLGGPVTGLVPEPVASALARRLHAPPR